MKISILLVDDHQMFRDGLRAILDRSPDLEVIADASNGRQAVELATGPLSPQVIIMDIGMPGLNGADATRQIMLARPDAKVIALSAHADRRFVATLLEAGASGYVLKEAASDEILRAILAVTKGRKFLSAGVAGLIIDGYLGNQGSQNVIHARPLGPREREVLQLLAEGKTSKQIARSLHISDKTVEVHRRNIMQKLSLHSIAELTKYAIREGLTSA